MKSKNLSSSSLSSSSSNPPPTAPHNRRLSTTIEECKTENHCPTPLHNPGKPSLRRREVPGDCEGDASRGVLFNKCRPIHRDNTPVVPLFNNGVTWITSASPNRIFKSILSPLSKKSPRASVTMSPASEREEMLKIELTEITHKLIKETMKRDEAISEALKLKHSMAELEKKMNNLELYCHRLITETEISTPKRFNPIKTGDPEKVVEHFLVTVSESRYNIQQLSRSLALQLRQMGSNASKIKPFLSRNERALFLNLEAGLNRAFFEDFESIGFQKSSTTQMLDPINRCETNFNLFNRLQGLTWEEVLEKGTRHYSEGFSGFCDRKMSEIVSVLGWNRPWSEPLLHAFFGAAKSVWLVHLLANSVHPGLPVFRVDKGSDFDPVFMEVVGGEGIQMDTGKVRVMITPGWYVFGNVVKCKVICK